MEKHKVLLLLHLPPPVHGSSMVGQFVKDSRVISGNFQTHFINILASKKVDESGKVNFRKLLDFAGTWFTLLLQLFRNKPKLCYFALTTTGVAFYRDILLVALLKLFQVKRIYHLHNKGVSNYQNHNAHRFFYNFIFKGADVILLSKYLYSDIQAFVPESKIHICPNGIPEESSQLTTQSPKTEAHSSTTKILFLSNLTESKGVFVLLEACSLLKKKGILFGCDFIGGEGDITAAQFEQRVEELKLSEQLNYLGEKYNEEKYKAYSTSDVFVHPTLEDCFPLVLLEAMQYSLPTLSTFEGGIASIVKDAHTGFLVQQYDVIALADKLEILLIKPELRQKMGKAGRAKFKKEFTLPVFEQTLNSILQKVIE